MIKLNCLKIKGEDVGVIDKEFADLLEYTNSENKTGPPVADIIRQKFEGLMNGGSKESVEKLKDKLLPPENCKNLCVPKVNPEIWNNLSQKSKSNDLRSQILQKNVLKGVTAFANVIDGMMKNEKSLAKDFLRESLKQLLDGAESLANAFLDISANRRQEVKPSLDSQYAGICSIQEHGEFLFGTNIVESLKASKSVSGVMKGAMPTRGSSFRFASYKRRGSLNYSRPPFRGQGNYRAKFRGSKSPQGTLWSQRNPPHNN